MKTQKGQAPILILVGILIIMAVAGGTFYLGRSTLRQNPSGQATPNPSLTSQSTPIPTPSEKTANPDLIGANWKTFTGKQYTFKYPDSWTDDVSSQNYFESGVIVHSKDVDFTDFSHFNKGALIYKFLLADVLPKSDFVNLDAVMSEFVKSRNNESVISESNITVDGQPAKNRITKGSNVRELFLAFQYPNNKGYSWLIMLSSIDSFEENKKILDQILSTFKFTDQINDAGKACGGLAGETGESACPSGYKCKYPEPMYPDAQGECVLL